MANPIDVIMPRNRRAVKHPEDFGKLFAALLPQRATSPFLVGGMTSVELEPAP